MIKNCNAENACGIISSINPIITTKKIKQFCGNYRIRPAMFTESS
jgi:hypothetical protein